MLSVINITDSVVAIEDEHMQIMSKLVLRKLQERTHNLCNKIIIHTMCECVYAYIHTYKKTICD